MTGTRTGAVAAPLANAVTPQRAVTHHFTGGSFKAFG